MHHFFHRLAIIILAIGAAVILYYGIIIGSALYGLSKMGMEPRPHVCAGRDIKVNQIIQTADVEMKEVSYKPETFADARDVIGERAAEHIHKGTMIKQSHLVYRYGVVCASKPIPDGQTIAMDSLDPRTMPASDVEANQGFYDVFAVAGRIAKTNIPAGKVVCRRAVTLRPDETEQKTQ